MQLGDEQAGGGVAELHRADEAEQVVPVVGDQLGLDGLGEQRPGVRVPGAPRGPGAEAVELQSADVADAWGELQAGQIEDPEGGQGLPGGVGGVLGDRQVRGPPSTGRLDNRDPGRPGTADPFETS